MRIGGILLANMWVVREQDNTKLGFLSVRDEANLKRKT